MITFLLSILLLIYISGVIFLLLNFMIRGYNVTLTTFSDNKQTRLEGFQKVKWCMIICLFWPIVLIKNLFE